MHAGEQRQWRKSLEMKRLRSAFDKDATLDVVTEYLRRSEQEYKGGYFQALADSVFLCERKKVPPPEWISSAVSELVREKCVSRRKRGRLGNPEAETLQHRIHMIRWAAVVHFKKNFTGRTTWPVAYAEASRQLRGTLAQGEAETMKRSYLLHARHQREIDSYVAKATGYCSSDEAIANQARDIFEARSRWFVQPG